MASKTATYQRHTYLIDRRFQLKYSAMLGAAGGITSLLFGAMVYFAQLEAFRYVAPGSPLAAQLGEVSLTLAWLTGGTALFLTVTLAIFGIYLTHRVAGPVFVMNHYLSVIATGKFPKMRPLRKTDELKNFFLGLQTTIEYLRTREATEAVVLEEAVNALTQGNVPAHVLEKLTALRDQKMSVVRTAPKG
jgi:hypothetical protein